MSVVGNPYQPPSVEVGGAEPVVRRHVPWQVVVGCVLLGLGLLSCAATFYPGVMLSVWKDVEARPALYGTALAILFFAVCGTQAVLIWLIWRAYRWALWLMICLVLSLAYMSVPDVIKHQGPLGLERSLNLACSLLQICAMGFLLSARSRAWFRGEHEVEWIYPAADAAADPER